MDSLGETHIKLGVHLAALLDNLFALEALMVLMLSARLS
jgi:hypothetical protein